MAADNPKQTLWARLRKHGPCMIFDWHHSEVLAREAIDLSAKKEGEQVRKFQTVAFFPDGADSLAGKAAHQTHGDYNGEEAPTKSSEGFHYERMYRVDYVERLEAENRELCGVAEFFGQISTVLDEAGIIPKRTSRSSVEYLGPLEIAKRLAKSHQKISTLEEECEWKDILLRSIEAMLGTLDHSAASDDEDWRDHVTSSVAALVEEVRNLRAALKQPRTQWQDISSAPRCAVLVSRPTDEEIYRPTAAFLDATDEWRVFRSPGGNTILPFVPTHWMELPEPPEARREARMAADGITEEDIAETMPPKPEDAR